MNAGQRSTEERTDSGRLLLTHQGRIEGQDSQGFAQHTRPKTQHADLHVPIAVVDHAQVNVHPGGDADQTFHHGCTSLSCPYGPCPESRCTGLQLNSCFLEVVCMQHFNRQPPDLAPPRSVTNMEQKTLVIFSWGINTTLRHSVSTHRGLGSLMVLSNTQ